MNGHRKLVAFAIFSFIIGILTGMVIFRTPQDGIANLSPILSIFVSALSTGLIALVAGNVFGDHLTKKIGINLENKEDKKDGNN